MAVTLRKYLNNQLKAKGLTVKKAKKNASKYKSIAAAKKAGSLYYTNKDGKVMAAVYAEDLKKPTVKPKLRPNSGSIKKEVLLPGSTQTISEAINKGKNPKGRNDTSKRNPKKNGNSGGKVGTGNKGRNDTTKRKNK